MAATQIKANGVESAITRRRRDYIVGGFLLGVGVTILLTSIGYLFWLLRDEISRLLPSLRIGLVTILALLFGFGLFVFRQKARFPYGVAEILFGGAAILQPVYAGHFDIDFVFKLGGGLYIVVRGLDNIDKAFEATGNAPFAWKKVLWKKGREKGSRSSANPKDLTTSGLMRQGLDDLHREGNRMLDLLLTMSFTTSDRLNLQDWQVRLKQFCEFSLSTQQQDTIMEASSIVTAVGSTERLILIQKLGVAYLQGFPSNRDILELVGTLKRIMEVRNAIRDWWQDLI